MKLIVPKQSLLDAINVVQRAIMPKATQPILEGIYLEADESLKLFGNNFDFAIEYNVDADITDKGSIVINARMFGDIIRKLPDAPIYIEVTDNFRVKIECLSSYFEIVGMDAGAYPMPSVLENEESSFTITQASFKDLIKQTIFAVGSDENRKIMTGVLLEVENNEVTIAALDGFRMAVSNVLIKEDAKFNIVVPGKNMSEVMKILESTEDLVKVSLSDNTISFILKDCRICSNILDGEFMNYRGYIPSQFETIITVNTKELIEGIERASLITSEDKRFPVKFNIGNDNIVISSTTDLGISKDEINITNDGDSLEIGFNPRYFIDALKVIEEEKIKISFTSSVGPCIITSEDNDKYIYLILPVRMRKT